MSAPASRGSGRGGRIALLVAVVVGVAVAAAAFGGFWRSETPIVERCRAEVASYTAEGLTPTQAEHAALLSALSVERGMPARAATIAIATAFQESSLYNIDYGDRDSVGLFQQRPSQGWGSVEEIMDPYYATHTFYDALVDVPGYTDMDITVAAQEVQISAYPDAYAQHEPASRALASALTGESPGAFNCTIDPDERNEAALAELVDELEQTFGEVRTEVDEARVDVAGDGDTARGWAIAHWALAHASRFGVDEISYDGRVWSVDDSADGWREDTSATDDTVDITFV